MAPVNSLVEDAMSKPVSALVAVVALLAAAPAARAQGVTVDVTPEQQAYQARTDAHIRDWIHDGNHQATDDERHFIESHWRRAARLWRIRHLARAAHDMTTVARVDRLLARADHILEIQLDRMRAHAPIMTVAPGELEVTQAPPPPQVETRPPPVPGQMWVPGYWQWNGHRHMWNRGHYAAPPQAGMVYEPARWENRHGHWAFIAGRWKLSAPPAPTVVYEPPPPPATVVEVQAAPPPPLVEVRPPAPRGAVWIPGYWHWNGHRHSWISGRWSAPRRGMRWEPDHWVRVGPRYRLERGHWAR
jgi:hypothetical protein